MHKTLLAALAAVLLAPAAQACSLLYDELDDAALAGDKVLTNIGQDAVVIDLLTGKPTTLSQDFFPRFDFAGQYVLLSGQKGLGADCSGTAYFKVLRTSGQQVHSQGRVLAFDGDGARAVWLTASGLYIADVGAWSSAKRIGSGVDVDDHVAVALDDAAGKIAVSRDDGSVTIHDARDGKQTARFDIFGEATWGPVVAWHQGGLVVGRSDGVGEGARFWVFDAKMDGSHRAFGLQGSYDEPTVATGAVLLLYYGDTVLRVRDDSVDTLRVPSPYKVASVAGDKDGAVVLLRQSGKDGWESGAGILRILGTGGFGDFHTKAADGDWDRATRPAFSWKASSNPPVTGAPTAEDAAAAGFVFAMAALAYALGRRRTD